MDRVPPGLRVRRAFRRFPPVRSFNVLKAVWLHPANRGHRVAAINRSVRWQVRSRVREEPLDVTVFGTMTMRCHPRSNAASNVIYFTERHDPIEMAVLESWLRPGDIAVDVGANIGTYTLLLARAVGDSGSVVALEPVPSTAVRLRENVDRNRLGQVEVVEAAAGRATLVAQITVGADVSNTLIPGPGRYEVQEVAVRTLDEVLDGRVARAVKIDAEGFEAEVLAGATGTLGGRPVLVVEVIDVLLRRGGSSAAEVIANLEESGFLVVHPTFRSGAMWLTTVAPKAVANVVAVPRESWADFGDRMGAAGIGVDRT